MRLRTLFALTLIAAAATGCSGTNNNGTSGSSGSTGSGADAGSLVGNVCAVDAECVNATQSLRCDPDRRQCICLSDADCPGQFCSNFTGRCVDSVPGCTDNSQCAADTQFCNPQTRACQDVRGFCEGCKVDIECGTGNHCLAEGQLGSFCTKNCNDDPNACPSGTTCNQLEAGDSQCLPDPGSTCATFTGCVADTLVACDTDDACAPTDGGVSDQVCDVGSGVCRARVPLCPLGTVCDPSVKVCVNSCSVDRDCSSDGTLACVNQICRPLSQCADDTNCPTDKVCDVPPGASAGQCVPFCTGDTACGVGRVCQPVIEPDGSTRQACLPGCVHNSDCPPDSVCEDENGAIFVTSGTALGQCNNLFSGAQACQASDACASCQTCSGNICVDQGSLGFCQACDPNLANNAGCANAQNGGAGATCLSLAGRSGGQIVSTGPFACGVPCGESNPAHPLCPKDFVCASLTDASGASTGVYNCIPADFDCGLTAGQSPKCQ